MTIASSLTLMVTTGDPEGIGLEITLKALKKLSLKNSLQILVFASRSAKILRTLGSRKTQVIDSPTDPIKKNHIAFLLRDDPPANWVQNAATLCLQKTLGPAALVTAPMSKQPDGSGHTDILQKLTPQALSMGFLGSHFNVALATTHMPIDQVSSALNTNRIETALRNITILKKLHGHSGRIRLLGLNPHAGENGVISRRDSEILETVLRLNILSPPLSLESPDAAFTRTERGDTFLAWYHDQGLIPFKMKHGYRNGIQVTLGLPFIRTSVDHGTAKDIFGKNMADPSSMILAVKQALRLSVKFGHTQY